MTLVAVSLKAIGAGDSLYTPETQGSPIVILFRALRSAITATLPEVTAVPEGTSVFRTLSDATPYPFLAMVGRQPRPADAAVRDTTQTVPVDFLYVHRAVVAGIADVQEFIRGELHLLQRALLANYRQSGAANTTRLIETPVEYLNAYRKEISDLDQPLLILVMSMEFDVIESQL